MPRLPHSLLLQAHKISPLLPPILRATRDLPSAKNELRWLIEYVQEKLPAKLPADFIKQKKLLLKLCLRRQRSEPLQYILGSQPFGDLDIKCLPGVLIPRPETETYTEYLAKILIKDYLKELALSSRIGLRRSKYSTKTYRETTIKKLKILDCCSGTGCISLYLYSLLREIVPKLSIYGFDLSQKALKLSLENMGAVRHLKPPGFRQTTSYIRQDLFAPFQAQKAIPRNIDVIVSNPPYISRNDIESTTARSVRNWEPRLALVPSIPLENKKVQDEDVFYHRLIELHRDHFCSSKILVMEVGSEVQAGRVVAMARAMVGNHRVEVWADFPEQKAEELRSLPVPDGSGRITITGTGSVRCVVLYRRQIKRYAKEPD